MNRQQQFDAALDLLEQGKSEEARSALVQIAKSHGESAALFAKLGSIEWDLGRLTEAIVHFRKATHLAPQSETASLGLFHCLWENGEREAALEEVKRFQSVGDSEDYRNIVRDLNAAT